MGGGIIARGIGLGVLAMALNVAIALAWVWFYSTSINPGHDGAFYQGYGQAVAPILAIAVGIPVLLLAGWLSGRGIASPVAPLLPALTYVGLDVALMAGGGLWAPAWSLFASYLTKLGAAWAGGRIAQRGKR